MKNAFSLFLVHAKNHKGYLFFKILQMSLILLVVLLFTRQMEISSHGILSLKAFPNPEHIYRFLNTDDDETFEIRIDREGFQDSLEAMYRFLKTQTSFSHNTILWRQHPLVVGSETGSAKSRSIPLSICFVSPSWFAASAIVLLSGNLYTEGRYRFNASYAPVPALVGPELAKQFPLGRLFTLDVDGEALYAEVIGILPAGTSFPRGGSNKPEIADSSIVLPPPDIASMVNQEVAFGFLDMFISHAYVVSADYETSVNAIQKEAAKLDVLSYTLVSINDEMQDRMAEEKKIIHSISSFLVFLLALMVLSIVGSQLYRIYTEMRSLGIHLLCGATPIELALQLFFENIFICLLPWLALLPIALSMHQVTIHLSMLFPTMLALSVLLSALPANAIMHYRLSTVLRRTP